MKLYFAPNSRSVRSAWLLEELGLDYELERFTLGDKAMRDAAYLAKNPNGRVPVLEDGDVIDLGDRVFEVIDEECVACNLCVDVCPVEGCISMVPMAAGEVDPRTGKVVQPDYANWTTHPNNPSATAAE